jgi:AcrR family transcriptional regulator
MKSEGVERRRYDSPVRRRGMAETRRRILSAGAQMARELQTWDWSGLTLRAVADRAQVSERTVYRHFGSERRLHDAIVERLREDAGVFLDSVELDNLAENATRMFAAVRSHGGTTRSPLAEDFQTGRRARHAALLRAVEQATPGWSTSERTRVAALLDLLWLPPSHEHLVAEWGIESDSASDVIEWVIGLVAGAARSGDRPAAGGLDSTRDAERRT